MDGWLFAVFLFILAIWRIGIKEKEHKFQYGYVRMVHTQIQSSCVMIYIDDDDKAK